MTAVERKILDVFGREITDGSKVRSRVKMFAHYASQSSFRDVPSGSVGYVKYGLSGPLDEFRVEFAIDDVVAQADYAPGQIEVID